MTLVYTVGPSTSEKNPSYLLNDPRLYSRSILTQNPFNLLNDPRLYSRSILSQKSLLFIELPSNKDGKIPLIYTWQKFKILFGAEKLRF